MRKLEQPVIPQPVIVLGFSKVKLNCCMKYLQLFYHAGRHWFNQDMSYYAAAFSYYAPLSLIPLILLSLSVCGFFYGADFVKNIFLSWGTVFGSDVLDLLNVAVKNLEIEVHTYRVPFLMIVFFSGVSILTFNVLGSAFYHVWGVTESNIKTWLRQTLRSISFVIILQLYLIFIIGTEGFLVQTDFHKIPFVTSIIWFMSISVLFVLLFKLLVKHAPSWRACVFAGLVSGFLFIWAKELIGIYLAFQPVLSIFGAAGLMLILLIWVYVLASIILYGASLANMYDKLIVTK